MKSQSSTQMKKNNSVTVICRQSIDQQMTETVIVIDSGKKPIIYEATPSEIVERHGGIEQETAEYHKEIEAKYEYASSQRDLSKRVETESFRNPQLTYPVTRKIYEIKRNSESARELPFFYDESKPKTLNFNPAYHVRQLKSEGKSEIQKQSSKRAASCNNRVYLVGKSEKQYTVTFIYSDLKESRTRVLQKYKKTTETDKSLKKISRNCPFNSVKTSDLNEVKIDVPTAILLQEIHPEEELRSSRKTNGRVQEEVHPDQSEDEPAQTENISI